MYKLETCKTHVLVEKYFRKDKLIQNVGEILRREQKSKRSGKIIRMTDEASNVNGGSSINDSIPVTVQSSDVTSYSEGVILSESIVVTSVQTENTGRNIRPRGTLPPIQPPITTSWPPYGLPPGYTAPVNSFVPPVRFRSVNGGNNSQNPQQYSEYSRDYNVASTSNASNSMAIVIRGQNADDVLARLRANHGGERYQVTRIVEEVLNRVGLNVVQIAEPRGVKNPKIITKFAGEVRETTTEHVARYLVEIGNLANDENLKMKSRCYVSLPQSEVVKIALMGLGFYMYRKLLNVHIPDLAHLAERVRQVELMKKEKEKYRNEQKLKSKPFTRKEKVAYVTMESSEEDFNLEAEVNLAKLKKGPPNNDSKLKSGKKYSCDISKSDQIFDVLLKDKQLILPEGRTLLSVKDLKGKPYCKFYQATSHSTNSCVRFRDLIQEAIMERRLKFDDGKKEIKVDVDPFDAEAGFA
ncbi:hypothetical protein Ahy_B03g065865 [Arachis hypogaea]|uniref:Uncharacterized protein n=1 Tax=Arachis hypogaea TaxID=3818 RepID=A0A445A2I6_ARAHY|nr:hypothetical protein Ahy_B03g065865 [Arachis hypogaea]